jgi:glutathione S-transferase
MQLIGMLDSPYVRRVAISMKLMGIPYEHRPLSVFRNYDEFRTINPAVKVPTLICNDGEVLMDSSLILDYLEGLVPVEKRLMPIEPVARRQALKNIGVALAVCEKSVQRFYELNLRPLDKRHAPWLDRVTQQMNGALAVMEKLVGSASPWLHGERFLQDDICVAVAWRFTQFVMADAVRVADYPQLAAYSLRAELRPEFLQTPLD